MRERNSPLVCSFRGERYKFETFQESIKTINPDFADRLGGMEQILISPPGEDRVDFIRKLLIASGAQFANEIQLKEVASRMHQKLEKNASIRKIESGVDTMLGYVRRKKLSLAPDILEQALGYDPQIRLFTETPDPGLVMSAIASLHPNQDKGMDMIQGNAQDKHSRELRGLAAHALQRMCYSDSKEIGKFLGGRMPTTINNLAEEFEKITRTRVNEVLRNLRDHILELE